MIEFQHRLPAMHVDGGTNGTYNNWEMVLPCVLTTKDTRLGEFLHLLHNLIHDDRTLVFIDGQVLTCDKNWIRDHVHIMKGFKHWEYDLKSFMQFILDTQREDGCFYELIKQLDDPHWQYVDPDCYRIYEEDNVALVRLELEADIEYLMVEGAVQVYRATGDRDWLMAALPKLEKGIRYMTSDPKRWNETYGLVVRPFTVDTWDFTQHEASSFDRRIHENEPMSIMHGDNSGVYQAMCQLAWIRDLAGDTQAADDWRRQAQALRENMFRYLWNGRFFMHQYHIDHPGLDDKEAERLSLSNPYDINRGVTDLAQSRSIIREYQERRKTTKAFAEWFSIDPPYEKFHKYYPGEYVNGAISPFTAGELAKAALENGCEDYGWDILCRFMTLSERDGSICFLYSPDNEAAQEGGPSAWGAAALLSAVDEALAGIVDTDCLYRTIRFSPRFVVTDYTELRYITGYEVSHTFVNLRFIRTEAGLRYDLDSPAGQVDAHILLPPGKTCSQLLVNGAPVPFTVTEVAQSRYVDAAVTGAPHLSFEVLY